MDYIHTLLIMKDDLDKEPSTDHEAITQLEDKAAAEIFVSPDHGTYGSQPVVDWCVCGQCRAMPQLIENKCCKLRVCVTTSARFAKLYLDTDVLELCIRNMGDIRNDRKYNSTRSFRKASYRQFILARHGHLGNGNRRVCPSCVVLKIRQRYPSVTRVYMGYREH